MELRTHRLNLRELSQADVDVIHQLHSLAETDKYNTLGIPATIETTLTLVSEWISTQNESPRKKYVLCLESNEGAFIGLIGLNLGKPAYRNAEIWFKLFPEYWNHGFATEAVNSILHFCFTDLALHRVTAGCAVENVASAKVLEKAGMLKEGRCRQILPIRGEWHDNFEFAILESDFLRK